MNKEQQGHTQNCFCHRSQRQWELSRKPQWGAQMLLSQVTSKTGTYLCNCCITSKACQGHMYNGFLLPKALQVKSPPFHHVDQNSLSEMWTRGFNHPPYYYNFLLPGPWGRKTGSLSHRLFGFWVSLEREGGVLASAQLCAVSKMVLCG